MSRWTRVTDKDAYRARKRRERNARLAKGQCSKCTRPLVDGVSGGRQYCAYHLEQIRSKLARQRQTLKLCAFNQYGGAVCKCCGETRTEFLSIDHVQGGGGKHRKEIKTTS